MCDTCNTLKGTKGSKVARQFFTHAYFDQLAFDCRFLVTQVAVGRRHIATNFALDFSADLDAGVLQRLAYQFSVLRLGQRYQLEAVDLIHNQASKLKQMEDNGCDQTDLVQSLLGDERSEIRSFGINYWRSALLGALAKNEEFYKGGYKRVL